MKLARLVTTSLLIVCGLSLAGCASLPNGTADNRPTNTPEPTHPPSVQDPTEARILAAIPNMKPGAIAALGELTYVTGRTYTAASGRKCRPVTLTRGMSERTRIACANGQQWFFSPEVFAADFNRE